MECTDSCRSAKAGRRDERKIVNALIMAFGSLESWRPSSDERGTQEFGWVSSRVSNDNDIAVYKFPSASPLLLESPSQLLGTAIRGSGQDSAFFAS